MCDCVYAYEYMSCVRMCVSAIVSVCHVYVYVSIFMHFFVSVVCVCVYTSVCLCVYTYTKPNQIYIFLVYKHIISFVQLLTLL